MFCPAELSVFVSRQPPDTRQPQAALFARKRWSPVAAGSWLGHVYRAESFLAVTHQEDASAVVAVTQQVLDEVRPSYESSIEVYRVKEIAPKLRELWTDDSKQPSLADLSLVQAALENPEICGIITYDRDFKAIATRGFIRSQSSKSADDFWVGTAKEYLEKTKKSERR